MIFPSRADTEREYQDVQRYDEVQGEAPYPLDSESSKAACDRLVDQVIFDDADDL